MGTDFNLSETEKDDTGTVSRTHMSNIEALNMPTQISVDTLFKIADVLGIKVSNLFEEI